MGASHLQFPAASNVFVDVEKAGNIESFCNLIVVKRHSALSASQLKFSIKLSSPHAIYYNKKI